MSDELKDQRIPIMMSPSEVKAIDDWMFANRIKSRAQAIRKLCQASLASENDIKLLTTEFAEASNELRNILLEVSNKKEVKKYENYEIILILRLVKSYTDFINKTSDAVNNIRIIRAIAVTPHDTDDGAAFDFEAAVKRIRDALEKKAP